jgi:hypothetical protein
MATSSQLLPFLITPANTPHAGIAQALVPTRDTKVIRRRAGMREGVALEVLGHAIEYLIDSRMFLVNEPHTPAEADAVQILSRCSREVFVACPAVVSIGQRIRMWTAERLRTGVFSQT